MLFKKIFKTLILTELEYGFQAWCPYLQKDIRRLERVQRRATKCVQGLANFPYRERLLFLGLTCLELRRWKADMVLLINIIIDLLISILNTPTEKISLYTTGQSFIIITPNKYPT